MMGKTYRHGLNTRIGGGPFISFGPSWNSITLEWIWWSWRWGRVYVAYPFTRRWSLGPLRVDRTIIPTPASAERSE